MTDSTTAPTLNCVINCHFMNYIEILKLTRDIGAVIDCIYREGSLPIIVISEQKFYISNI